MAVRRAQKHLTNPDFFRAFHVAVQCPKLNSTGVESETAGGSGYKGIAKSSGERSASFFDLNLRMDTSGLILWRPNRWLILTKGSLERKAAVLAILSYFKMQIIAFAGCGAVIADSQQRPLLTTCCQHNRQSGILRGF